MFYQRLDFGRVVLDLDKYIFPWHMRFIGGGGGPLILGTLCVRANKVV
jgi:hypothetical protein